MMCKIETISLGFIAFLFVLHFIADFVLQSREMGKKKSSHPGYLASHVLINMAVFFIGTLFFKSLDYALLFSFLNGAIHGIIDASIWNLYKWTVWRRQINNFHPDVLKATKPHERKAMIAAGWEYWNDHLFYVTIGFDQLLHGLTLLLVMWILK